MPGIHLAAGPHVGKPDLKARILRLQEAMKYSASYRAANVVSTDRVFLGYTCHDAYPILAFEVEGCHVVVEGVIYNKTSDQIKSGMAEIAARLVAGRDIDATVRSWVTGRRWRLYCAGARSVRTIGSRFSTMRRDVFRCISAQTGRC